MKLINAFASLALLLAPVKASPSSSPSTKYDGYHVYRIPVVDQQEASTIERRLSAYQTMQSRDSIKVAVPSHQIRSFNAMGLDARLLSNDLGKQVRDEAKPSVYDRALHKRGELPDLSWYDTYHDYADHLQYWDDLAAAFPNNSEKFVLGPSYENRTIYAYNYYGSEEGRGTKPVILWHSTVHAREWIATLVLEYWAYQLIDGYNSGDSNVTSFFDTYDFWLVPFHNPDGFVYTQTTDRLWRKNREPRLNETCVGTDLNRNWAYKWGVSPGASPDPCSESYQGLSAGDTPENTAVSGLSDRIAASAPQGIRSYVDLHSYGQKILTPYGWTCDPALQPTSLPRMLDVAGGYAAAVNSSSSGAGQYQYGTGCAIEYYSAGNGRDHHYGVYAANHSWTLELEPVTDDEGGFVLPPERIRPVVEEQWAGQLWLLDNVRED